MGLMAAVSRLISVDEALGRVLEHVSPGASEAVPLRDALGRVLAQPLVCDLDYPPFDKAAMDGYAVRAEDISDAAAGRCVTLKHVGAVGAGHESDVALRSGQAIQINTGAPVPQGADAVVRVEDTESEGDVVRVMSAVARGTNIVKRATYVSAGSVCLNTGQALGPGEIAVAAAAGAADIEVYGRPRVAVLVTGDELVDVSANPSGAQIRNSNGPMLESLIVRSGGMCTGVDVVGDDRDALAGVIRAGLVGADVLCLSGGISMGAFDFVPEMLASCGVRFVFRKVAIKPGKPTLFGVTDDGTCVFGLPGNPVSAFVAFRLFVHPALLRLQGLPMLGFDRMRARLNGTCKAARDRSSYTPVRVAADESGTLRATRIAWQGSGDPFGLVGANGLLVRRAGEAEACDGDDVLVLLL